MFIEMAKRKTVLKLTMSALLVACMAPIVQGGNVVFTTDFSTLPPEFTGVTTTVDVQDLSGVGTGSNTFSGQFLINGSGGNPADKTVLLLEGLPAHSAVSVRFLLAILETWDGIGGIGGADFFHVEVDGQPLFTKSFANVSGVSDYAPPAGVLLGIEHYWGGVTGWSDQAFDMGFEPAFQMIPHTASSLRVEWFASGTTYEGIANPELWGIDNVEIELEPVPEPSTFAIAGAGLLGILLLRLRRV